MLCTEVGADPELHIPKVRVRHAIALRALCCTEWSSTAVSRVSGPIGATGAASALQELWRMGDWLDKHLTSPVHKHGFEGPTLRMLCPFTLPLHCNEPCFYVR